MINLLSSQMWRLHVHSLDVWNANTIYSCLANICQNLQRVQEYYWASSKNKYIYICIAVKHQREITGSALKEAIIQNIRARLIYQLLLFPRWWWLQEKKCFILSPTGKVLSFSAKKKKKKKSKTLWNFCDIKLNIWTGWLDRTSSLWVTVTVFSWNNK